MDMSNMQVKNGKVVFKQVAETCEAGNHVFNKGAKAPCDCGAHPNFEMADAIGVTAEAPLSQEPVLVKKHLSLILGGKR